MFGDWIGQAESHEHNVAHRLVFDAATAAFTQLRGFRLLVIVVPFHGTEFSKVAMSDEELYAAWLRDRGKCTSAVPETEKLKIIRALREKQLEQPFALEFCGICNTRARGPHHPGR